MKNNGWKSYLCLEIVEKMKRFALLNFTIFWGQCSQTPKNRQKTHPKFDPVSFLVLLITTDFIMLKAFNSMSSEFAK